VKNAFYDNKVQCNSMKYSEKEFKKLTVVLMLSEVLSVQYIPVILKSLRGVSNHFLLFYRSTTLLEQGELWIKSRYLKHFTVRILGCVLACHLV